MLGGTAKGFAGSWGQVYMESLRSAAVGEVGRAELEPGGAANVGSSLDTDWINDGGEFYGSLDWGSRAGWWCFDSSQYTALKFERLNR